MRVLHIFDSMRGQQTRSCTDHSVPFDFIYTMFFSHNTKLTHPLGISSSLSLVYTTILPQHLWKTLVDKGYIYLGTYEGWYSIRDECFYSQLELVDGKAPTGADVEWVAKEKSYFFKLSTLQDRLLQHYEDHPDFIAPVSRKNEVLSFVNSGLRDLSISRTSFKWGVKVPGDDDHVMYVWIDALTNYISALGYPNTEPGSDFEKFWPASLHMVGKDITRFHAVYWPAMLMAADLPLPRRLFAHGWWTKDGQKISKSLGNVIDPIDLVEKVRGVARALCCSLLFGA
jgi:methionyl-tRNA synthetase